MTTLIEKLTGDKAIRRISKRVLQENKAHEIFQKTLCISGGKKCSFFGKFGVLCFLVTPVLRFALLPYYQRTGVQVLSSLPPNLRDNNLIA